MNDSIAPELIFVLSCLVIFGGAALCCLDTSRYIKSLVPRRRASAVWEKPLYEMLKSCVRNPIYSTKDIDNFYWDRTDGSVSPTDMFYHIMMGLNWPKVVSTKTLSSSLGNIKITLENSHGTQDIWFFTSGVLDSKLKNEELLRIAEEYQKRGIREDEIKFETTRRIIENARGVTFDELERYGFYWR